MEDSQKEYSVAEEIKFVAFNAMGTKFQLTMEKFLELPSITRLSKLKEIFPFDPENVLNYCDSFDKKKKSSFLTEILTV